MTTSPPSGPAGADEAASSLLARLFDAAAQKANDFVVHLHPTWVDVAWPGALSWVASATDSLTRQDAGLALQAAYNVQWPGLQMLAKRTNRVALLPRPAVLQVLCITAMYVCRSQARRSVGRSSREKMVELVGEDALAAILAVPGTDVAAAEAPPLLVTPTDALAGWAFGLLGRHGWWSCPHARTLIGLSLSPAAVGRAAVPVNPPRGEPALAALPDRLLSYLPEYAWLFGSDMDRALSA